MRGPTHFRRTTPMKIYLAAMAASLMFAGYAGAANGCGGGEKSEACEAACSAAEAKQVAKSDACAAACDAAGKTCPAGATEVVKGGASADNVATGYSLGQRVPDFQLDDATGKSHSLSDFKDGITVLVFYNQECPYV